MASQQNGEPVEPGSDHQADSQQETITYVFPSAGQNSTAQTVIVGGTNLTNVNSVYFGSLRCVITEFAPDGTTLTVTVPANAQYGSVTVTAGRGSLLDGYEFLRLVVGYRAFGKWSADGDSWKLSSSGKFQKRVPGQTSYSIPLIKDGDVPIVNAHDDTWRVWRITMCAMVDEDKIVLLDPDPEVKNQTDKQYPPPGNRGLVLWQTKQMCMPCNLAIGAQSPGSALLTWDASPAPIDPEYTITGYRVFRKPSVQPEWPADMRWFSDTTDKITQMVVRSESQPYSYTVLPKAKRAHDPQEIVFGTDPGTGMPFPDDQSNMIVNYGAPKRVGQYPPPYGQMFVLQNSIGSVSISAFFGGMHGLQHSSNAYQWQESTVDNPDPTKPGDWVNVASATDTPLQGQHSPVLTFGKPGYPVKATDKARWYRLRARNGGSIARAEVFSWPVQVYVGTQGGKPTPALISQSPPVGPPVYVENGTYGQVSLTATFNNIGSGAKYQWGYSKKSATGPYEYGLPNTIRGDKTRTMTFGNSWLKFLHDGASAKDSGWYQLQVKTTDGQLAYSDPVRVIIGKAAIDVWNYGQGSGGYGGPLEQEGVMSQYPLEEEEVVVPMDAKSENNTVSISAYPRIDPQFNYTLTVEKSLGGSEGPWTSVSSPKGFPDSDDVDGRSSALLIFTPNGDYSQYKDQVEGYYRLRAVSTSVTSQFTVIDGKECISDPVKVTVVSAGGGKPQRLGQSRGTFAAATGSFGADAVSIEAHFTNMRDVRNGYRWEYTKADPPTTGWTDSLPAYKTLIGLGTPTLTFGAAYGMGAQAESFGWYRLTATNQFGSATSDPILVRIYDIQNFQKPTISSISPSTGTAIGGTPVTIRGTNLLGATAVVFAANPDHGQIIGANGWDIVVNSDTELTLITPAQLAAKTLVTVYTPRHASTDQKYFTFT